MRFANGLASIWAYIVCKTDQMKHLITAIACCLAVAGSAQWFSYEEPGDFGEPDVTIVHGVAEFDKECALTNYGIANMTINDLGGRPNIKIYGDCIYESSSVANCKFEVRDSIIEATYYFTDHRGSLFMDDSNADEFVENVKRCRRFQLELIPWNEYMGTSKLVFSGMGFTAEFNKLRLDE